MIKINLLPVRAAKKKETAIQQLVIAGGVVVLIAVVVTSLYLVRRAQVTSTKADITSATGKINELKKKIGKLEELKAMKTQVKKKLDVLAQLRKNKTGPAQRLASLSDLAPDQLWLTNYNESGQNVKISGIAFTEELIARFMRALETSNDFMSVELLVSEQAELGGTKLKKFDMSMKLQSSPTESPVGPAVKK
ncbi:MAG: PilN domain-containing protein [Desulfuromonadaceae bacterium]|nr:PilN domain-containing protein [Desulfuromonadaceae bacterium]MDD5105323.1 PilN domain-containing protein [Desulfuromonadaceae bacterium]